MDKNSQFQKIICVLLIFTILIYFSGCYSSRVAIPRTDLPLPDASKYYYVIHTQNWNYLIKNGIISNGILSGKIEDLPEYHKNPYYHNKIHIYLSSDTIMKISPEKIISIPIDGIVRVLAEKAAYGATIALVAGTIIGLYAVYVGVVSLIFSLGGSIF